MKWRKEKDFFTFFKEDTGEYFRSSIIAEGKDTGKDPFMATFPELLDVGIMGNCTHGKNGLCIMSGVECYQDGLHSTCPNMSLEDFEKIATQCEGNTYQFALGGCGDPDQHEHFREILEICKTKGITPNFTTSGLGLSEQIVGLCYEYCGAVAVSWYRSSYTLKAISMLVNAGVKTNIHYVLGKNTIKEAIERLRNRSFPEGINAIIFLLHKPVGLGTKENVLTLDDREMQEFLKIIKEGDFAYKIGFDACTVPALVDCEESIFMETIDTCEAARWSAYIDADMKMMPCSFGIKNLQWAVDLREHTIQEAWNSAEFENFRKHFSDSCPECKKRDLCMGGCPICPEIVLCEKKDERRREDL